MVVLALLMAAPATADETSSWLAKAEQMFGARQSGWHVLETIPHERGTMLAVDTRAKTVQALVTPSASGDKLRFQVSHEVVHMLNPAVKANKLEEGIAAWFSYAVPSYSSSAYSKSSLHQYLADSVRGRAFLIVEKLEATKPGSMRKLRKDAGSWLAVKPAQLRAMGVSEADTKHLLSVQ